MNALQSQFTKYVERIRSGRGEKSTKDPSDLVHSIAAITGQNNEGNGSAKIVEDRKWISRYERDLRCYPQWLFKEKNVDTEDWNEECWETEVNVKEVNPWQPREPGSIEVKNYLSAEKSEKFTVQYPPVTYPFNTTSLQEFLDKFKEMPKATYDSRLTWKYPEATEWTCRIVNLKTLYHAYEVNTVEFEWDDPTFQEKHTVSQQQLNQIYIFVRDVPECKIQWKNGKRGSKLGVVDLGDEGFHRCVFYDDTKNDPESDNEIYIRLIDTNKPMTVRLSWLYLCLQDFVEYPPRCNDFFLYQFALASKMDCFRQHVYKYFKNGGNETTYKAVVRFWNRYAIPVVDLYTLDNPPAYVNDLIAANIIDALPGQKLPKSPSGICDVFVPYRERNGRVGLQIQTLESQWFIDVMTEVRPEQVERMIKEYQKQGPAPLDRSTIYYAEYDDGWYYRVKLLTLEPANPGDSRTSNPFILANYIDYGNTGLVKPDELIPAACVHPSLERFKPQCVVASLTPFSKTSRISREAFDAFWKFVEADRNITVEVLSDAEEGRLPVVDIVVVVKGRPETRLSKILTNLHPPEILDLVDDFNEIELGPKLDSRSPYDRRPSALDSLEAIDMKQLCWTRPPRPTVMLKRGVNVLVTITKARGPNEFTIQPAKSTEHPDAWEHMENRLMHWEQLLNVEFLDPGYHYLEQQFYCCSHPYLQRYIRVMYVEKEMKETFGEQPFRDRQEVETVRVYAVDYGDYFDIDKRELKMIGREFCSLPPRALPAGLIQTDKWTDLQNKRFSRAVKEKTFCFRIKKVKYQDGIPKVTGQLYQASALDPTALLRDCNRETFYELHHYTPSQNLQLTMEDLDLNEKAAIPEPEPSPVEGAAAVTPAAGQSGSRNLNPKTCGCESQEKGRT